MAFVIADEKHDHGCKKIGRRLGVLCAFFGAVAAVLMLSVTGLYTVVLVASRVPVVIGLIALFIAARWLGSKAGRYLCEQGCKDGVHLLTGIGLAFGSIALSVLAGAFTNMVMRAGDSTIGSSDPLGLVVLPLFGVLIFGGIPAIGLGLLYGFLVKKELSNMDYYA